MKSNNENYNKQMKTSRKTDMKKVEVEHFPRNKPDTHKCNI